MKLGELITIARRETDDIKADPPLWTDQEWIEYANDAENEACRRARLLVDSTEPEITQINVAATVSTYDLDPRVIFIRRVKLTARAQPLGKISFKQLDEESQGWEDQTGQPRGYITDLDTGKLRAFPTPVDDGTIRMTVVRLPLKEMKDKGHDCPEIHGRFHRSLRFWMLYRAYSKQDSQTLDKQKAADNLAMFEAEFGPRSSAQDEAWIEREHGYDNAEGLS